MHKGSCRLQGGRIARYDPPLASPSQYQCFGSEEALEAGKMSSKRIISLFMNYGSADYIGEPVSVLDHSLQAAALARDRHPLDQDLIIAALLHDIGHLLGKSMLCSPRI
jgi:HD superfamily phosphodiesterase